MNGLTRRPRGRSVLARRRREISVEGLVEGVLLEALRGAGGGGYAPLPRPGRGFAELSAEEKNRVSSCSCAVARTREWFLVAS